MTLLRLACIALGAVLLHACTPPSILGDPLKTPADVSGPLNPGKAQCSAAWKQTEVNLMGWDGSSRAALGAGHRRGAVVVHYEVRYIGEGCSIDLELLPNCHANATYAFAPSQIADHITVHNMGELYATLPLGAASLKSELQGDRALRADYMLAGIDSLPPDSEFHMANLGGSGCERATHVVSRVYLGGFAMSSGESRTLEAAATLFGAGAGGKSAAQVASSHTEGNVAVCIAAQQSGRSTNGCDIPLEVGLLPVAGLNREACTDLNACNVQCSGGDASSCDVLGQMYAVGQVIARSPGRARELFERACDGNYAPGCVSLALLYEAGDGVTADIMQAALLFDRGCRGGDPAGCLGLGLMYEHGDGVQKDASHALSLYTDACQGGIADGCARAMPLLDAECKGGDAAACSALGAILENGSGTPADAKAASGYYQRSCEGGDVDACIALATLYLNGGKGLQPEPSHGAAILTATCEGGETKACTGLATVYLYGRGVPENAAKALKFFEKACTLGEVNSCVALAHLYSDGIGGPVNLGRAIDLLKRSCDGQAPVACTMLANIYEDGKGVPKDVKYAISLYKRACANGVEDACNAVERLGDAR